MYKPIVDEILAVEASSIKELRKPLLRDRSHKWFIIFKTLTFRCMFYFQTFMYENFCNEKRNKLKREQAKSGASEFCFITLRTARPSSYDLLCTNDLTARQQIESLQYINLLSYYFIRNISLGLLKK